MDQRQILQQLLEDMDTIRPIVIAAMPEDLILRATTRRMISDLESMQQEPSVPATTYLWLSQITARLLDAEHGALLRPENKGEIPPPARQAIWNHTEQRQSLLMEALHSIPAARRMLDQCCIIIGKQPTTETSVQDKARHLSKHLHTHIQQNGSSTLMYGKIMGGNAQIHLIERMFTTTNSSETYHGHYHSSKASRFSRPMHRVD